MPKKRVAAYARVSLETEMLHHSLSAQISYYSSLIQKNPEWEYAGEPEHLENLIRENARVAQDQDEYAKKKETFRRLYDEKHSRYKELEEKI